MKRGKKSAATVADTDEDEESGNDEDREQNDVSANSFLFSVC